MNEISSWAMALSGGRMHVHRNCYRIAFSTNTPFVQGAPWVMVLADWVEPCVLKP